MEEFPDDGGMGEDSMGPKEDTQGTSCHRPIPHPSPVTLGWQAQAQASQFCVCGLGWGESASCWSLSGRLLLPALKAGD